MWFDPSVAPLVLNALMVPILTRAPFNSPVVILNSIIQFRRVFLLMMAAGSTNSHPLFMYLVSNCIVHISFDTHLLDSLWILIWTIMCWDLDEELFWLVCTVLASPIFIAAKMIFIQEMCHPEDQLQKTSDET